MKIYIVTSGEYSDYGIDAVFLDKEKALKFQAQTHCDYVEEYDTADEAVDDGIRYKIEHIAAYYNGKLTEIDCRAVLDVALKNQVVNLEGKYKWHGCYTKPDYKCIVYLDKQNKSLARKIMFDMIAQYKAEREGL